MLNNYLSLERPVILAARDLVKSYHKGKIEVPVLRGVDLDVLEGEFLAITGQSGSGKSTLLHLLATLDRPDAGEIYFEGHRVDNLPAAGRDILRNRQMREQRQVLKQKPHIAPLGRNK